MRSGVGRRSPRGHLGVEAEPHPLEVVAAAVDAGHAAVDQQAGVEQLAQERRPARASPGRNSATRPQTSLAISSRLASVAWIRSLATISRADIESRRWRPTLNGVSFL